MTTLATALLPMRGDAAVIDSSNQRPVLDLTRFSRAFGLTAVLADGDIHDPYFSGKALICAHQLGMSVHDQARAMLDWLLPKQRGDGSFARYCLRASQWEPCLQADADDSMCAIVIELISMLSMGTGIRSKWQSSIDRCQSLLGLLRSERGTYNISAILPVQLLMDNCEVYESLVRLADCYRSNAMSARASQASAQAESLGASIVKQFWQPATASYLVTSQSGPGSAFYPDATGQLFPLLGGLYLQPGTPGIDLQRWIDQYGSAWLNGSSDHYPWGLIAMGFHLAGRTDISRQWLDFAGGLRGTSRWNVLEEAIFQGLSLTVKP